MGLVSIIRTYRKSSMLSRMVMLPMTLTLKGQGRDPNMLGAQYLENGWRYRLGYNGAPIKWHVYQMVTYSMTSHGPTAGMLRLATGGLAIAFYRATQSARYLL